MKMTDREVATELAESAAEYVGQMMVGGLDGSDLPSSVNFGPGQNFGQPLGTGVIELDDGRLAVLTVTITER